MNISKGEQGGLCPFIRMEQWRIATSCGLAMTKAVPFENLLNFVAT